MDDAEAVHAVLIPPQLERFRELCGVDGPIEPRFVGFTKHVLLTQDRAFLFPRNHTIVVQLERESDVYSNVDHPLIPRLLGQWHDHGVSPYPFFAVNRLEGTAMTAMTPDTIASLGQQLGAAIAEFHSCPVDNFPSRFTMDKAAEDLGVSHYTPLRFVGGVESITAEVSAVIGASPVARDHLSTALEVCDALPAVLAHGDLHESQLLSDEHGSLTGILDWGFSGILSPLCDFTNSQFEADLLAAESTYSELRHAMWEAYAAHRHVELPSTTEFELAMAAFDVVTLGPESRTHYYWQKTDEWRANRRSQAVKFLQKALT